MNKTKLVKNLINLAVTVGTGKIVGDIIKNNTDPQSLTDKVTYRAGTYALGGMIATKTASYTDVYVDEFTAKWTKTEVEVKEN